MTNERRKENPDYEDELNNLKAVGLLNEDIEAHLLNAANSNIQDIMDVYSEQYRKTHGLRTLPESFWKSLKRFATLKCANHCEKVASTLRSNS